MKSLLKPNIALMVIFVLFFTGCEKWIDTDRNINPDVPSDVPMNLLVPTMELSMSYQIGGIRAVKTTNIYMQFLNGVARQSYGESNYIMSATDVDDLWRRMYYQPMMDAKRLIEKAGEQNSPHYAGVAKVCLALSLGTMTNLFGDIPYSEAFQGDQAVLKPDYDTQEEIYNTIGTLLDEAITDLGATGNIIALSGDIIYSNNKASWTKAAYALKARYALYLGEYDNALTYTGSAFSSNDNFIMTFGTSNAEAGPIYQYATVSSYKNDIKMCSTFIDKLVATTDPRRTFYAKTIGGAYVGSPAGSEETNASGLGTYNNTAAAPVVLSSYAEMQFIRAECYLMKPVPDNDAAAAAYKAAVASSVLAVTGVANTAWLDANINTETGATITLEKIIEQKYLAMYSTVVPYDDYRRTGYPALTPVAGAGQIPARFPYPQTEIAYNSYTPVITNTNQKLWIFQ
ncbi:MAG TPA: SusD/RagB family nutrient-binding outer membrane lipoprotein [Bacteroidales bacterium]|nr:SusD/RagB family nutrient-binding outer membrane lipoprotein [Bacteroidales bacterium]